MLSVAYCKFHFFCVFFSYSPFGEENKHNWTDVVVVVVVVFRCFAEGVTLHSYAQLCYIYLQSKIDLKSTRPG